MIYKNYEITTNKNAWGYFEAINLKDCDAFYIYGKTIEEIKIEIDEL